MNKSPNLHSNFFSSLKQVGKRLKLEPNPPPPPSTDYTLTETSPGSPIFLNFDENGSTLQSSSIPREFLSNSDDFPLTHENPPPQNPQFLAETHENPPSQNPEGVDEIGMLISLLGFSDDEGELGLNNCSSCGCGGGFYDKIVGVKGPKCQKEVERLDGWIRCFREEEIEPLRMAHLLLGKASILSRNATEFEFPYTVGEFLQNDEAWYSKARFIKNPKELELTARHPKCL